MRTQFVLTAAALAAIASSAIGINAAKAAPLLQYQVYDGTTVIGSGSSTNGNLLTAVERREFPVSLNASGSPFLTAPNFSTNSFNVSFSGAGDR